MRIGVDARPLAKPLTGIPRFVHSLCQHLSADRHHEFRLYLNRHIPDPPGQLILDRPWTRLMSGMSWYLSRAVRLATRDQADIFWATQPMIPPFSTPSLRWVVTAYDVVWLKYPETMMRRGYCAYKMFAPTALARAERVITISQSMKRDLIELGRVPEQKIEVIYCGLSPQFQPLDKQAAARVIAKIRSVPEEYMLALATLEPRKNLCTLFRAVELLKKTGAQMPHLVLAGWQGWKRGEIIRVLRTTNLAPADVSYIGHVPDAELPLLYSGARLFLFPSLYEGFGLPPLEALACGTPVVSSNAAAMPEILGDAALYAPPLCAKRFADAIYALLRDARLYDEKRSAGLIRSQQFTWGEEAQKLVKVFEGVAAN